MRERSGEGGFAWGENGGGLGDLGWLSFVWICRSFWVNRTTRNKMEILHTSNVGMSYNIIKAKKGLEHADRFAAFCSANRHHCVFIRVKMER